VRGAPKAEQPYFLTKFSTVNKQKDKQKDRPRCKTGDFGLTGEINFTLRFDPAQADPPALRLDLQDLHIDDIAGLSIKFVIA
jgi:hypothetical protein